MSEPPRIVRPVTARPRRDAAAEVPAAPDAAELAGIEEGAIRLVELAGATRAEDPALGATLLTWRGRGPAFNHVTRVRWSMAEWPERSERVAARLRALAELPVVDVLEGLTEPPDLALLLAGAGWAEVGGELLLWTRRARAVPHLDLELRLEAVTARGADEYESVERAIFGVLPSERDDRRAALRRGLAAGLVRAYLVRVGGEAVATARLLTEGGLGVIHGLGVVDGRRRQGIGRYLTTIVTRAGLALGASLVWLAVDPANDPALALYEGLDYRLALRRRRLIGLA
ncbi:MAG: GNAT family N-acetyltransferase [Candidatus Limnocylindrales bacterium]